MTDRSERSHAGGPRTAEPGAEETSAARLVAWFERQGRDLPWRRDRHPYRVWVSEVMLQQTRVDTVEDYFERFLERFPTVEALAAAPLEDVLKAWQGLGYYRRARMMHRAAGILVAEHHGRLPEAPSKLRRLPGFGPYTASAVAAFAFGRPVIAVDANVRRVGARFFGREHPEDGAIGAGFSAWLADVADPAALTEGLIELGALVCTPRAPACTACPLRSACLAAATGSPEDFGRKPARHRPPTRRRYARIHIDDEGVWLMRRPLAGLLGGMWGFPQSDAAPAGAEILGSVAHAYSHFRLELVLTRVPGPPTGSERRLADDLGGILAHVAWRRVGDLPISGVDGKAWSHLATLGLIDPIRADRAARAMMTE